jgi:hypothetical protein
MKKRPLDFTTSFNPKFHSSRYISTCPTSVWEEHGLYGGSSPALRVYQKTGDILVSAASIDSPLDKTKRKRKQSEKTNGHHYLNGIPQQQVCGIYLRASLYQVIHK